MAELRVKLRIDGDGNVAVAEIEKVQRKTKDLGTETERSAQRGAEAMKKTEAATKDLGGAVQTLKGFIVGAIGAVVGIGSISAVVGAITRNTIAAEQAMAQVEARIKSTGGAAGVTSQQLAAMAARLQDASTFDDDAIMQSQSVLLSFTSVVGEQFGRAQQAILDLSVAMGTDLNSATVQVGKALNEPATALTALQRSGIQFNAAQEETIQKLVETGRTAEAQGVILAELERQFGGSAKAARDTFGGAMEALRNTIGNLLEADGGLGGLSTAINAANERLQDPRTAAAVQRLVQLVLSAIPPVVNGLVTVVENFDLIYGALAAGLPIAVAYFGAFKVAPALFALVAAKGALATGAITGLNIALGAAVVKFGALKVAAGIALAGFAGWQIGSYLREQFIEAELFGIAFVGALMEAWERLKQSGQIAWEAIKATAVGAVNIIRGRIADMLGSIAGLADIEVMGVKLLGSTADAVRQLEAAIRPTTSAYDGFLEAKKRITAETAAEIASIRKITGGMADDAIARRGAAAAADEQAAATAGAGNAMQELIEPTERGTAATKTLEQAARNAAQAMGAFQALERSRAAAVSPIAAAAASLVEQLERVEEIERQLAETQQLSADRARILAAARGDLVAQYQDEVEAVLGRQQSAERLLDDMALEARLAGLSRDERDRLVGVMRAEEAMRRAIADAQDAGRTFAEGEIDALVREAGARELAIRAMDEYSFAAEQAARDAERPWLSAVDSISRAWGDWLTGGIRSFRDFGRSLLDIARRTVADLIATFMRTRLLQGLGLAGGAGASGAAFAGTGSAAGGGGLGSLLRLGGIASGGLGALAGLFGGTATGFGTGLLGASSIFSGAGFLGGISGSLGAGVASLGAGAIGQGLGLLAGAAGPIALAAAAINAISGGRLFGTSWKPTGTTGTNIAFGPAGATGEAFEEQSRRRSLFRGTARRTVTSGLDDRQMAELDQAFDAIETATRGAAEALRVEMPPLIAGAWREVRDKAGNVVSQTTTILGRQFTESFEDFQRRLSAENLIEVVQRALGGVARETAAGAAETIGGAIGDALAPIGIEIGGGLAKSIGAAAVDVSAIAERWRGNASELLDGAQFLLAAAVDIQRGVGLLGGPESLAGLVDLIEDIAGPSETLIAAYQRAAGATALLDRALRLSGVTLDDTREAVVRFAVGIAEAAGGLDQASRLWERYFEVAFTPLERLQAALAEAESIRDAVLAQAGLGAESTVAEIRGAVEAALAAGSDPEQVVRLLQAADAVGRVNELLAQLADLASESAGAFEAEAEARRQALATYAELASELMREVAALGASDLVRALGEARSAERERIAALNDAARAAGMQAAREEDLARAHLLAADAAARAIARARAAAQSIVDDLYGTPLQQIEAQIGAIQGAGGAGGLSAIAAGADEVAGAWQSAIDRIRGWLDDLMTGPLGGLRPRDALAEARRQFDAVLAAARGGDAEAAGRLPQLAEQVLRLGQRVFASGDPYVALRDEVRGALQSVIGLSGPGNGAVGGGAVGVVGAAVNNNALAELLRQRDELLAAQEADRRRAQAEELAAYIREIAQVTGELPLSILAGMGVPLERFAADLGIRLDDLTVETTGALSALANRLAIELPDLAAALGLELGSLADANSLVNDALEAVIARQPPEIAAALAPLLARLEDALTPEEQAAALNALEEYIGQLAPALRVAFAPFFDGIDPETVDEQIAILSGARDIAAESLVVFQELERIALESLAVSEMIGVDTMVEQRRTTSAVDRAAEAQTGALREVRDAVDVGLGEVVRAIREAMQPVEPVVPEASFAVGTARVPRDMLAQIHRDEAVIDARSMRVLRDYGIRVSGGGNSDAIVAELRQLREERSQADSLSRTLADRIERLERAQRETAAAIERQTAVQRRSFA